MRPEALHLPDAGGLASCTSTGAGQSLITASTSRWTDVVSCVSSTGIDQQCVTGAVATMEADLDVNPHPAASGGPGGAHHRHELLRPVLGGLAGRWRGPDGGAATVPALSTFNSDLAQIYSQFNVPVADVFDAFQTSDTTEMVSSPWGTVPVAVDNAYTWLDITCTAGQIEGFGDDPVDSGAKVIAGTFETLIGSSFPTRRRPRRPPRAPQPRAQRAQPAPQSTSSTTTSTSTTSTTTTPTTTSTSTSTTTSTYRSP